MSFGSESATMRRKQPFSGLTSRLITVVLTIARSGIQLAKTIDHSMTAKPLLSDTDRN
tara:strand:- start:105270 stop:105443 length:174 start_codon:yes stop_codon:yes gene_type:complete